MCALQYWRPLLAKQHLADVVEAEAQCVPVDALHRAAVHAASHSQTPLQVHWHAFDVKTFQPCQRLHRGCPTRTSCPQRQQNCNPCVLIPPPPPPTWLLSASRSPHSPASQRLRPRRWARRRTPGTARAAALTAAAAPDGRGGSSVAVATCGARSRSEICWGCRHAPSKPLAAFSHGATRQSRRGTVSQVTAVHPPVSPLCAACCAGVPVLPAGTRHPSRRLPRVKAETSIHRKQRLYSSCCEQQIV